MIYHITSEKEWEQCEALDFYAPARFDKDGFIHCSAAQQVKRIADTLFRDHQEVWVLYIDDEEEKEFIKYENLEGGEELFPHIYHKLPKKSIINRIKVKNSSMGFRFPGLVTH